MRYAISVAYFVIIPDIIKFGEKKYCVSKLHWRPHWYIRTFMGKIIIVHV